MTDDLAHKLELQIIELRKDMQYLIARVAELEATNVWMLRIVLGGVIAAVLGMVLTH